MKVFEKIMLVIIFSILICLIISFIISIGTFLIIICIFGFALYGAHTFWEKYIKFEIMKKEENFDILKKEK